MTDKLYYEDPYLQTFEADVVSVERSKSGYSVVLNRTAFYPEGGGQPSDCGTIDGIKVLDVKKEDDIVVHTLEGKPTGPTVSGRIDWSHRFDYMQQHTGQHVISGALISEANIATVSVHQGEDYTTIETDAEEIDNRTIEAVEAKANEVIGKNVPLSAVWTTDRDVDNFPLRRPPKFSGKLRIIQVGDFDCVACGGVHTERTGEVGLVHCIGTEKIRGHVRTIWKIGRRAYEDYREKTAVVSSLVDSLSVKQPEIVDRVGQIQENLVDTTRQLHLAEVRIADLTARSLLAGAQKSDKTAVITATLEDEDKGVFRSVVERLAEEENVAVCLLNRNRDQTLWSICVTGREFDFRAVQAELLAPIEGKGGGRPPIYQGVARSPEAADAFFARFRQILGA